MTPDYRAINYDKIKQLGYYIDVRGPYPTLHRGMQVWRFLTWDEALAFALQERY